MTLAVFFLSQNSISIHRILHSVQRTIPSPRFTFEILDLTGPAIQIHLISTGGSSYISNLSNPIYNGGALDNVECFGLCGSKYLPVKSDGVDVVDIAFEQEQDCRPK